MSSPVSSGGGGGGGGRGATRARFHRLCSAAYTPPPTSPSPASKSATLMGRAHSPRRAELPIPAGIGGGGTIRADALVPVQVAVAVKEGVVLWDGVGEPVELRVGLREGVRDVVMEGVTVGVGVRVGVTLGEAPALRVGVGVALAVKDA